MSNELDNQFIGGEFDDVTESKPVVSRPTKTADISRRTARPAVGATADVAAPVRNPTLDAWQNAPLADPDATVIAKDAWGRKVELHKAGWEAAHGIDRRYTTDGEMMYLANGLMGSTLLQGQVYGGGETYIQAFNSPTLLKMWAEHIDTVGTVIPPNTKKSMPPRSIRVQLSVRENGDTLTVGLCPMYEVFVLTPGLVGLKLLVKPEQLLDSTGTDGYGNKP